MNRFLKFIVGSLAGLSCLSANAQQSSQSSITSIRLTSWGAYDGAPLYVETAKEHVKVDVFDMVLSPVLKAKSPLVLYKSVPGTGDKPSYVPVLSVPVPATVKLPLVLIRSDKGKVSAFVGECSPEVVPYEGMSVTNFSKVPLGLKVGNAKVLLNPGMENAFKDCGGAVMDKPFPIEAYTGQGGEAKMIYESADVRRASRRLFVFFYQNPQGQVASSSITDFKEIAQESPTAAAP